MEPIRDLLGQLRFNATPGASAPSAPSCPRCGGTGFLRYDVPYGDPRFGQLVPCGCKTQEIAARRADKYRELSRMGLLADKRFETFRLDRGVSAFNRDALQVALRIAERYAAAPQGWLVLTGPSGCGKSHLAAAIANAILARNEGALWVFVPDFLDHLRTTFSPSSDISYDELFATVRDAPVLILDDLGAHSSSPWAEEKLYQVLAHRYDARLPTVITTSRLIDSFEGRIRSRLLDGELSRVVAVVGYASEVVNRLMSLSYDLIRRMTFENFNPQPYSEEEARRHRYNLAQVLGIVQNYVRDAQQRKWLVLMGVHGCGKTHLTAAMANERLSRGLPTLFINTPDLLDALRATFGGEGVGAYDKVFYEVRATPFLILDDFGAHSATPWAKEKLYQILNYRYNAQLATVITTNQTLEEIDPPLQSRMSDQEYCGVIAVLAPDYRKTRGALWKLRQR
ncbi:ATP-binding protein [Kallotenue papyrolyticum]|uniref:ATP-binding protein n=1 Tax=Kallotenue papyrolyticum TaxID=1325125 RepID=UPI00049269E3|nr:ATP-binding protein [Kallotenue papyrolyticum]